MMYYLHLLSEEIKGFNVFSYVTFRAVAAAVTAFVLSLAFGNFVIRKLIALKAGHPSYFVMFYPQPLPGQTIESVCSAEAQFLAKEPIRPEDCLYLHHQ